MKKCSSENRIDEIYSNMINEVEGVAVINHYLKIIKTILCFFCNYILATA